MVKFLENAQNAVALATVVGMVSGAGFVAYDHFAKAADVTVISDRLDRVDERLLRQRQEQIDTLRLQREERKLNPDPRWIRERQRQLNYERCKYRQRFDAKVICTK
jgi:ABC-type phosphate transport system auxiliary subunit